MELSDPATPRGSPNMNNAPNRRKSGRVTQKPVLLNKDPNIIQVSTSSGKRKRAESHVDEVEDSSDAERSASSHNESDPDEEELKERRKKTARSRNPPAKSAAKKAKTGPSLTTNLAVRPAVNGVKKTTKPKKSRARPVQDGEDAGTGLYAEIFSQGHTLDAVAADWITRWEQNNTEAMRDLVNLLIRCTGCKLEVEAQDIEDADNVVSKLTDIQDEFQVQKITDYPIISKGKGNKPFRAIMTGFFDSLINTCHASGLLYSDAALYENLDLWVSTMSSSAIRPFRHTATVISLTMGCALCTVANELAESAAKTTRQKEGEQKKKSVNKERVRALEAKIAEEGRKRALVIDNVQQLFDQVFVHRYRDVDEKIRVDCASALGTWISTLPDHFFEGIYLRYLGWVLSDTCASTRAEVIKQLTKLFKNKDNVAGLRTFTERFRARMVEMAVGDSENNVRASTIELLDTIRQTGLLEPDDIDNVGRLVFDSEPSVRKAVAGFFAENIKDLFDGTVEDLGGEESLVESLGEEVEDDYDSLRISWIKLKCVAEALQSYDEEDEASSQSRGGVRVLTASGGDSRYALAAQTIYDGIAEARAWEILAGYLLYDFSSTRQASEEVEVAVKFKCKLNEKEEILLLEILNVAVQNRLSESLEGDREKKAKRKKAQKEESAERQEAAALHLAKIIPRLLKKFGSNSTTARAVLRLEHVLNLEIFQELRQDSTTYASLLDDINKQFLTHADQGVLAEASSALLHAREYDDLEEVTEDKLKTLWDDTTNAVRTLVPGGIAEHISALCSTVRRIENLARISDCTDVFDHEERVSAKKKGSSVPATSLRILLTDLIRDPSLDDEAGEEADQLLISSISSLLFYYMWSAHSIQSAITSNHLVKDPPDYSTFSQALISIIKSHHKASPVRVAATGTLLDLHTLFATFRHSSAQTPSSDAISSLVQHIPLDAEAAILSTYTALEKTFAKKSHKPLEASPDEDLASDPEDSSDDEGDDDAASQAQQESLMSEQRLCELTGKMVLAIVGRVLDHEGPSEGKLRERLRRNKMRLGPNFKEVIAYLDGPKVPKTKKKVKATAAGGGGKGKKVHKSVEVMEDEESDDEGTQHEEGGELDLRERELVEDRIVDPEEESLAGDGAGGRNGGEEVEDDDDPMGD